MLVTIVVAFVLAHSQALSGTVVAAHFLAGSAMLLLLLVAGPLWSKDRDRDREKKEQHLICKL